MAANAEIDVTQLLKDENRHRTSANKAFRENICTLEVERNRRIEKNTY
jgi:hypothetical protein